MLKISLFFLEYEKKRLFAFEIHWPLGGTSSILLSCKLVFSNIAGRETAKNELLKLYWKWISSCDDQLFPIVSCCFLIRQFFAIDWMMFRFICNSVFLKFGIKLKVWKQELCLEGSKNLQILEFFCWPKVYIWIFFKI